MRFINQPKRGDDILFRNMENAVYSPTCNLTFFNLLRELVDDATKSEFENNFDFEAQHMDSLVKPKNRPDKKTAFKIFQYKDYPLIKEVEKLVKDKFDVELETVDMENLSGLEKTLEKWLKTYTNDVFTTLINGISINRATSYKLTWANVFDQSKTTKQKFHKRNNDSVDVEMMKFSGKLKYVEDENSRAKMIELPCVNKAGVRDKDVSVLIYLPNDDTYQYGYPRFTDDDVLGKLIGRMESVEVDVSIPKFKIKAENNMKEFFINSNFDLTKFTNSIPHINEIISQGYLEMNEENITAVATTGCDIYLKPILKEMLVDCEVTNRFAKTLITHNFHNGNFKAQEMTFTVILPENAFITEFVMVIEGKSYKSYVKEKEEAKREYNEAVASGRSAAHVAVSARDSNKFTVSVNVAPQSDAQFLLTYEELLERRLDQYELVLNLHPGQILQTLKVKVKIEESSKIRFVKTPPMRSGNEICENSEEVPPQTTVDVQDKKAYIEFCPNMENQGALAKKIGKSNYKGLSGQFVVQYDVEVDQQKGEVLLRDGYFVHFFVPDDLPALPKHVIFTLDTSGSMSGRKIQQLRDAMTFILGQIMPQDVISIVQFRDDVVVYDLKTQNGVNVNFKHHENFLEVSHKFKKYNLPDAKQATEEVVTSAKQVIQNLRAEGSTHIIGALLVSLFLVNKAKAEWKNHQPIIVFLTDGEPNAGCANTEEITDIVTRLNMDDRVPIFTLSFGEEADKGFLRKLSLKNFAFSRHIYEAADASLQLQQFYKQISSPVMANVTFKYEDEIKDVTRVDFPIYFRGCDIVMCGRYGVPNGLQTVRCFRNGLDVILNPQVKDSPGPLERFWAFLTIKQLLERSKYSEDSENLRKKAMDLALKYSFVTEVTSLVVVKPEEKAAVDLENAADPGQQGGIFGAAPMALRAHFQSTYMPMSAPMRSMTMAMSSPTSNLFGGPIIQRPNSSFPKPLMKKHKLASASTTQYSTDSSYENCDFDRSFGSFGASSVGNWSRAVPFSATGLNFGSMISSFGASSNSKSNDTPPASFTSGMFKYGDGFTSGENYQTRTPLKKDKKNDSTPKEFKADKPFFVILQSKLREEIFTLFIGKITEPVY